eukprot:9508046-Ditylum_brightwellii.AAC.1
MHESLRAEKMSCMFQKLEEWFEDNYDIEDIMGESVATDSDGENNKTTSSDDDDVFYLENKIIENK